MLCFMFQKIKEMQQVFQDISLEQSRADIVDPDFVAQFNFYLVPVVLKWAKGTVSDDSDMTKSV